MVNYWRFLSVLTEIAICERTCTVSGPFLIEKKVLQKPTKTKCIHHTALCTSRLFIWRRNLDGNMFECKHLRLRSKRNNRRWRWSSKYEIAARPIVLSLGDLILLRERPKRNVEFKPPTRNKVSRLYRVQAKDEYTISNPWQDHVIKWIHLAITIHGIFECYRCGYCFCCCFPHISYDWNTSILVEWIFYFDIHIFITNNVRLAYHLIIHDAETKMNEHE